jgi:hypothetical protein
MRELGNGIAAFSRLNRCRFCVSERTVLRCGASRLTSCPQADRAGVPGSPPPGIGRRHGVQGVAALFCGVVSGRSPAQLQLGPRPDPVRTHSFRSATRPAPPQISRRHRGEAPGVSCIGEGRTPIPYGHPSEIPHKRGFGRRSTGSGTSSVGRFSGRAPLPSSSRIPIRIHLSRTVNRLVWSAHLARYGERLSRRR